MENSWTLQIAQALKLPPPLKKKSRAKCQMPLPFSYILDLGPLLIMTYMIVATLSRFLDFFLNVLCFSVAQTLGKKRKEVFQGTQPPE